MPQKMPQKIEYLKSPMILQYMVLLDEKKAFLIRKIFCMTFR